MTGGLISEVALATVQNPYIIKYSDVDFSTSPSSTWYGGIEIQDGNSNRMGRVEYSQNTSGEHHIALVDKKSDTEASYSVIKTGWDASGNAYCDFPNTTCVDGQWVNSNQALISSATSLNGSTGLTYRVDLPNDGHKYEVMIRGAVYTGTTAGNAVGLTINGNEDASSRFVCKARAAQAGTWNAQGTVTCIMSYVASNAKNLTVSRSSSWDGSCDALTVIAYRRIGTNA